MLDKPPFTLSGGEKQKVALAAILALDPKVILLDEPSASLDPKATGWLVDFLLDTEATVVVSTHNLSMAAEFNRCLIIGEELRLAYDGRIEAALGDLALLERVNLAHRHRHRHGPREHTHVHKHEWESSYSATAVFDSIGQFGLGQCANVPPSGLKHLPCSLMWNIILKKSFLSESVIR